MRICIRTTYFTSSRSPGLWQKSIRRSLLHITHLKLSLIAARLPESAGRLLQKLPEDLRVAPHTVAPRTSEHVHGYIDRFNRADEDP